MIYHVSDLNIAGLAERTPPGQGRSQVQRWQEANDGCEPDFKAIRTEMAQRRIGTVLPSLEQAGAAPRNRSSRVLLTTAHIYNRNPMACSLLNLPRCASDATWIMTEPSGPAALAPRRRARHGAPENVEQPVDQAPELDPPCLGELLERHSSRVLPAADHALEAAPHIARRRQPCRAG